MVSSCVTVKHSWCYYLASLPQTLDVYSCLLSRKGKDSWPHLTEDIKRKQERWWTEYVNSQKIRKDIIGPPRSKYFSCCFQVLQGKTATKTLMTARATCARTAAPAWMASTPTTASVNPNLQVCTQFMPRYRRLMDRKVRFRYRCCSSAGQLCTEDVDECQLMPNACQNGGTCHNTFGSYQCVCVNGWTGNDCSENIDDCASAACHQGSTCHDRVASFYCECPQGRTGL